MRHSMKQRRGVLLLVVLSMLVLFVLAGVTIIVVAGSYKKDTLTYKVTERTGDPPQVLLDQAMYGLLRGTLNVENALLGHSILEDLHGRDGFAGFVSMLPSNVITLDDQIQQFDFQVDLSAVWFQPQLRNDYYNGCVLTFVRGATERTSTRVLRFQFDPLTKTGRIDYESLPGVFPQIGDRFVVNGKPFNGLGAGYHPLLPENDLLNMDARVSWLPNYSKYPRTFRGDSEPIVAIHTLSGVLLDADGDAATTGDQLTSTVGGLDESYDAVDANDMRLAYVPPANVISVNPGAIVPSFHRPALVQYWNNLLSVRAIGSPDGDYERYMRLAIMRPTWMDHPKFTGSNPSLDPYTTSDPRDPEVVADELVARMIAGQWDDVNGNTWATADVDNDGDGIADSYWLDLGFPVTHTADGRTYKPLVAMLCVDLDSKVNVNTATTLAVRDPAYLDTFIWDGAILDPANDPSVMAGGLVRNDARVRGSGVGPAEIDLTAVISDPVEAQALQLARQQGISPSGRAIDATSAAGSDYDDHAVVAFPDGSIYRQNKLSDVTNIFGVDPVAIGAPLFPGSYATPPDLFGRNLLVLGHDGQPIVFPFDRLRNETVNDPYEINLIDGFASDSRVRDDELEYLLRINDFDNNSGGFLAAQRKSRLLQAAPGTLKPKLITSRSFEIPVPNFVLPKAFADITRYYELIDPSAADTPDNRKPIPVRSLRDLFELRLRIDGGQTDPVLIDVNIHAMMPCEILRGELFNINRPIGDGIDNDGNRVVDEPDENLSTDGIDNNGDGNVDEPGELPAFNLPLNAERYPGVFDYFTTAPYLVNPSVVYALQRQTLARHMYCMLMFLRPRGVYINFDGDPSFATATMTEKELATARGIAQWCINVVDFRDADSICTPFEYDPNPYDGWDVDGILDGTAPVVWGAERPELLITETLATHDRRTEDLGADGGKTTDDPPDRNGDFDQRLLPIGSLFIELFNPWSAQLERKSPDIYVDLAGDGVYDNADAVDLGRIALDPRDPSVSSPVWRIVVTESVDETWDLDHWDPARRPTVQRRIYFTDPGAVTTPTIGAAGDFYTTQDSFVYPGRYAVIGPRPVTTFGRLLTASETDPATLTTDTRRLEISANRVEILNNGSSVTAGDMIDPQPPAVEIPDASGIIVNQPRPVSLTEPIGGYNETMDATWDPAAAGGEGAFTPPKDRPLDQSNTELQTNRSRRSFRTIHLQRLANPLRPFDLESNPYLTVDSMPVDLTVFNGVTNDNDLVADASAENTWFHAVQRGDTFPGQNLLWKPEPKLASPDAANNSGTETTATHYFNYVLKSTLGYLNTDYQPFFIAGSGVMEGAPNTAGRNTFPWLTWNNRPFHAGLELLLVPKSRMSRIADDFTFADFGNSPYTPVITPPNVGSFGHLINFFQEEDTPFAHFLDYVDTRSPYVGTEQWYNPGTFAAGQPGASGYNTPFNYRSKFRIPGKINLNTAQRDVARAIWPNQTDTQIDSYLQNVRAYPLRTPAAGAYHVPGVAALQEREASHVGLIRPNVAATPLRPLFETNQIIPTENSARNPYFRYQSIARLDNLVTNHSNVYAVWITVGYFETYEEEDPVTGQVQIKLGQELGIDTGEVQRHRGFYMIDRSIPVAFEPGVNHNVDEAVILRRFIE